MNLEEIEEINVKKKHALLIIRIVNEFYGVNCLTDNRKREIVYPRQVAMSLIRKHVKLTQTVTGSLFNRDHACVVHAEKTVTNIISYNKEEEMRLKVLENKILERTEEPVLELEKSSLRVDIINLIRNYTKTELLTLKSQLS